MTQSKEISMPKNDPSHAKKPDPVDGTETSRSMGSA